MNIHRLLSELFQDDLNYCIANYLLYGAYASVGLYALRLALAG